jgi:uncharacterized protein YndB with AHSA1/START domain
MTTEPLTASVHIEAAPERVYEYLVDPALMVRWMGEFATLEPRPDGRFEVDVQGAIVRGRYVALEPPHRVVISWGYAGSEALPPGTSTVEVTLTRDGDGTRVELTHRDLPAGEVPNHVRGWDHYLSRLAVASAGGDAGADPGMSPAPVLVRREGDHTREGGGT